MSSVEANLELTRLFAEKLYSWNIANIAEEWRRIFRQINNKDSNEYNAFVLLCDLLFYNESKQYYLHSFNDDTYTPIRSHCCLIVDDDIDIEFPSLALGQDEMLIFKLVRWLYNRGYLKEIYEDIPDVFDLYFELIEDERFEIVYVDEDELDKGEPEYKPVKKFFDQFDIIKDNRVRQVFEALYTCSFSFRKLDEEEF